MLPFNKYIGTYPVQLLCAVQLVCKCVPRFFQKLFPRPLRYKARMPFLCASKVLSSWHIYAQELQVMIERDKEISSKHPPKQTFVQLFYLRLRSLFVQQETMKINGPPRATLSTGNCCGFQPSPFLLFTCGSAQTALKVQKQP